MTGVVTAPPRVSPWLSIWGGASIVLVALNLRPAVVGVGPLLAEIQVSEGMSGTAAGVLTALPVLCFGLIAPLAPILAGRFGIEWTVLGVLMALCTGIAVRAFDSTTALFTGTVVLGAAIAMGNVLMPSLVKRDFAHRVGPMTGLYSAAITAGGGLGAGVTVPIARAAGLDWRAALGMWGLFAVIATLAWLPRMRGGNHQHRNGAAPVAGLWRDALAWQVAGYMGLQSLGFYAVSAWLPAVFVARGMDPAVAGLLLALMSVFALGGALVMPMLAARFARQRALAIGQVTVAGVGLVAAWAVPGLEPLGVAVLGAAQGAALGLAMTLMTLRAPDAARAAHLSGMAQSVGYVVAAAGPFIVGALHDLTHGWMVPMLVLLGVLVPQGVAGVLAGRDRYVRAPLKAATTDARQSGGPPAATTS
jgi:CP family cyanate transporter-like MFS transporter